MIGEYDVKKIYQNKCPVIGCEGTIEVFGNPDDLQWKCSFGHGGSVNALPESAKNYLVGLWWSKNKISISQTPTSPSPSLLIEQQKITTPQTSTNEKHTALEEIDEKVIFIAGMLMIILAITSIQNYINNILLFITGATFLMTSILEYFALNK